MRPRPDDALPDEPHRRHRLRRAAGLTVCVVAVAGAALWLSALGAHTPVSVPDRATEPVSFPGAVYVAVERIGDTWEVRRSDGTSFRLDLEEDGGAAAVAVSGDRRWLSYTRPGESALRDLLLLRADQGEPVPARQVFATATSAHLWSPDSTRVLVPVADGDVNLVDTRGLIHEHRYPPGAVAGFLDEESLGVVQAQGERGDEGLAWLVTDLAMATRSATELAVGKEKLAPRGWGSLFTRQASLSPAGTRVAVLLGEHRGRLRLLLFSTETGELLDLRDTSEREVDLTCPVRWEAGDPVLTGPGESCRVLTPTVGSPAPGTAPEPGAIQRPGSMSEITRCRDVRLPETGLGEADFSTADGLLQINFSDTRGGRYRNVSYTVRYRTDPTCRTTPAMVEVLDRVDPPGWRGAVRY